ncbi:unspecified product [Leishmania tarentolae]|uniref:Unspecified product n=1 Tax=Leishmania tarentolae TaxID=5689 RepID=A0A640KKT4_LEITA|nr:unspecified product [Leishmania tarentolae]
MSQLVPAIVHGVLTDEEYVQCMRHYAAGPVARTWISSGDTAPALVWSIGEETARKRQTLASSKKAMGTCNNPELDDMMPALLTSDTRYRDQFLKLAPAPSSALPAAAHGAVDRAMETEHVLISEEDDFHVSGTPLSLSASQKQRDVMRLPSEERLTSTSPSPRRSGARVGSSPASRVSQRQSKGSRVVIVSQPSRKVTEGSSVKASAPKGRPAKRTASSQGRDDDGGACVRVGTKRQRSMEEFLYRGE